MSTSGAIFMMASHRPRKGYGSLRTGNWPWVRVKPPTDITVVTTHATLLPGLVKYYEATGYPPARELADKLANFLLGPARIMKDDGSWLGDKTVLDELPAESYDAELVNTLKSEGKWKGITHFHAMLFTLSGLFQYAQVMDRPEIMEQVRKAYEYSRDFAHIASGWVPEYCPRTHANSEPCGIADAVIMAARLSAAGVGDYWEDVERITRNLLTEAQITDSAYYVREARKTEGSPPVEPPTQTDDRVAERMIGTFRGMVGLNGNIGSGYSHCCTGNGGRGLYFAWRHILNEQDGELRVHLLLNRASRWADVHSHLPFQGEVRVNMKEKKRLLVRIPSWVDHPDSIQCMVNSDSRPVVMQGRYLNVGEVPAGQQVNIRFPLEKKTLNEKIGGINYTLQIRGFDVVDISPRNQRDPFFDNGHFRQDETRYRMLVRFVPEDELNW
jgi:hypothetical protein